MSQAEIDEHNHQLGQGEIEAMKANGRCVLYLWEHNGVPIQVGTWASTVNERIGVMRYRTSRNNWGANRTDVWFRFDGSTWHGVNVGDNDIVRVRRTKAGAK